MKIAITGSIGSGKSLVASLLVKILSAEHLDTDEICRQLLQKDQPGYRQVVNLWGKRFLDDLGEIDRGCLRTVIFADAEIRMQLEAILHPLVRQYLQALYENCRHSGQIMVVEVPLLFETGWQADFDICVVVVAPSDSVVERVVQRDGVPLVQIQQILAAQLDVHEKMRLADWVIDNSGSIDDLHDQVSELSIFIQEKHSSA